MTTKVRPTEISYGAPTPDGRPVMYHDYPVLDLRYLLPHRGGRVAMAQRLAAGAAAITLGASAAVLAGAWSLGPAAAAAALALAAAADGAWAARCAHRRFGRGWVVAVPAAPIPAAICPSAWRAVSTEASGIPVTQEFWVDVETFVRARRWHARVAVYLGGGRGGNSAGELPARALRFKYRPSVCYRRLIILVRARHLARRAASCLPSLLRARFGRRRPALPELHTHQPGQAWAAGDLRAHAHGLHAVTLPAGLAIDGMLTAHLALHPELLPARQPGDYDREAARLRAEVGGGRMTVDEAAEALLVWTQLAGMRVTRPGCLVSVEPAGRPPGPPR